MATDEPITTAQLKALNNKCNAFGLSFGSMGEPKTKAEATYQFKRLDSLIAQIKMGFNDGIEDSIDIDNYIDNDYLDPIY